MSRPDPSSAGERRPRASVIINNYNYGRFLGDAIESALTQTYSEVEVIVVDDGSTDDSRTVMAGFGDRISRVFKENGGQGSAMNAGYALSSGDMLIFLDSDDMLLPGAVAAAAGLYEPGVSKIHWSLWGADSSGKRTGRRFPFWTLEQGDLRALVGHGGPAAISRAPTSGNAWARSFMERVLPIPEAEFRICADGYLHTLAPVYGELRSIVEPQAVYRIHGRNSVAASVGIRGRRSGTFELHCGLLEKHLRLNGLEAEREQWRPKSRRRASQVGSTGAEAAPAKPVQRLVSVVINNHNYADFLDRAIRSALSQTYSPVEVIVVDDGSTDRSREVMAAFGDRIVPVLKANGGQASAFNAGFAASRGDVVVFLDADDELLPDAVERAVAMFVPGVSKVHWLLREIDSAGQPNGRLQPESPLGDGDKRAVTVSEGPIAGNSPPTSGNAWARWFLEQVLPAPEEQYGINADGYLLTLAWLYGQVRSIPACLGRYRVHGRNRYASESPEERTRRHLDKFLLHCAALESHARALGLDPKPLVWKWNKEIVRPDDEHAAREQLARAVPAGATLIFVDDCAFSQWQREPELANRTLLPFAERDGQYWGRPADSAGAIQELERLRGSGASFIAFPWISFWWLDHYRELAAYLRKNCRCVVEDERLLLFELGSGNDSHVVEDAA